VDAEFIKGVAAFLISMVVFVGSCWLLLSMILGVRLGYFVMATCFFGVMFLLSAIWLLTALGPKGPETTWQVTGVGGDLSSIDSAYGSFDVSDYPQGNWKTPAKGQYLADLKGENSTDKELENLKPVMEAFVSDAVSAIPGKRKEVAGEVEGPVDLVPGEFQVTDVKMKQESVDGKESLIAVGMAVPSANLVAGALPNGAPEGLVERFLVKEGDKVSRGDPVVSVKTDKGTVTLGADRQGKLIKFGLRVEDKIKQGVPFATVDLSGLSGAPEPVLVSAARVRGAVRTPSIYYLVASLVLLALHMAGLSRIEKSKKLEVQPSGA